MNGFFVNKDLAQAVYYLKLFAEQGDERAKKNLEQCFLN